MKLQKLFENWDMQGLKLNLGVLEMEWKPQEKDREAAWELYVELLTRGATQPLSADQGVETAALESIFSLFPTTREILRSKGRECSQFTLVAVVVLNQVIRPFTEKWHRLSEAGALLNAKHCAEFRAELAALQSQLLKYCGLLAEIAQVEDLAALKAD